MNFTLVFFFIEKLIVKGIVICSKNAITSELQTQNILFIKLILLGVWDIKKNLLKQII